MYRVSVIYGTPTDPAAFDAYYREVHIPLASKMQGLSRWTLTWAQGQDGDLDDTVYLIADLYAESKEAMDEVFASPEGQAAAADVPKFATGGSTLVFGEEEVVL